MRCRLLPFVFFALAAVLLAQSDLNSSSANGKNIKITGIASSGYAMDNLYFNINGRDFNLLQASVDGPSFIPDFFCTVGAECTFSFTPAPWIACISCKPGLSSGLVGGISSDFLVPALTFTVTGFYNGGSTLTMHLNLTGTVTGHQLINCVDNLDCEIGPVLFTVRITGHGTGEAMPAPEAAETPAAVPIRGISMSFSGVAHVDYTP